MADEENGIKDGDKKIVTVKKKLNASRNGF